VQATDNDDNPVTTRVGNPVYERNKDGSYVCDPNTVPERVLAYRRLNGLGPSVRVPVDAVTASASGLDPAISVANARLQAPRVARARHLPLGRVLSLVAAHTQGRQLGILGEKTVDVLNLNLALDATLSTH
jgi:K+-transporting ATPase ATPase C chain